MSLSILKDTDKPCDKAAEKGAKLGFHSEIAQTCYVMENAWIPSRDLLIKQRNLNIVFIAQAQRGLCADPSLNRTESASARGSSGLTPPRS